MNPSRGRGLVIQTVDGSPTLAAVVFHLGPPGTLAGAAPCLGFKAETPDAGLAPGYSQMTVYMDSSLFIDADPTQDPVEPPCTMDVVSVDGQTVIVTATMAYHHQAARHCKGNADCCSESGLEWLGYREFDRPAQTVSFTHSIDGSIHGAGAVRTVDAGKLD